MRNTKNYIEQGGDKWVIGGILEVTDKAEIKINNKILKQVESQSESSATTVAALKDEFNALLEKLKVAGLMKVD